MRTETSPRIAAAILAVALAPAARAADVSFDPTLNASWYRDGNVQVVDPEGNGASGRAVRLTLTLPVTMRRPLWSFRTSYSASGRMYNQSKNSNDVSHALTLGYNRNLSERNRFGVSATASRTEDQRIEPDAPDEPITYLPRTARTHVSLSANGGTDVSPRSDISWNVAGSTTFYQNTPELTYEDYVAGSAAMGWSYRVSEKTSSGFAYRYGRSTYDTLPDAQSHSVAYTGSTTSRREVGYSYALGIIATDTGNGAGWYTNGGASFSVRWNPRPDHALSAGIRQDVSPGRGLGGATLDRGAYVGWSWSHVRGLGLAVTGGFWNRDSVAGGGQATQSLYVSESLSWGFGSYLRVGVFHSYRDQTDDRTDVTGPLYDTSYHSYGINLGWRILGDRGNR